MQYFPAHRLVFVRRFDDAIVGGEFGQARGRGDEGGATVAVEHQSSRPTPRPDRSSGPKRPTKPSPASAAPVRGLPTQTPSPSGLTVTHIFLLWAKDLISLADPAALGGRARERTCS